ncbi:MAG: nicotinamide mononucleotide transporter PnuC, partial [Erysipelotrichaceae bacterium]|nr:nicotinamide mononucleotide transporter PnuC [Erysipelotrichaceae bacterium]
MKNKLKDYTEPNITIRKIEIISLILLLIGSLLSYISGISKLNKDPGELKYLGTVTMMRDFESEDYDEDSSSVEVIFENEDGQLIKTYTYEEYEELQDEEITAYAYETDEGTKLFFDHEDPLKEAVVNTYRQTMANALMGTFNLANALVILAVSVCVILFFGNFFTTYEKCWFIS